MKNEGFTSLFEIELQELLSRYEGHVDPGYIIQSLSMSADHIRDEKLKLVCSHCGKPSTTVHCQIGGCPLGADL